MIVERGWEGTSTVTRAPDSLSSRFFKECESKVDESEHGISPFSCWCLVLVFSWAYVLAICSSSLQCAMISPAIKPTIGLPVLWNGA